jgi:predicted enzyme related to lactoylglutathione lyase
MRIRIFVTLLMLCCIFAVSGFHAVQAQDETAEAAAPVADSVSEYTESKSGSDLAEPMDGAVVRVDIPSDDLQESREFYREVFGWTFTQDDETAGRYLYWHDPAGFSGGFSQFIAPGEGTGIVLYLHSTDLDESFKRINRAGGKSIDFTMEIDGGSARVGLFTDPQGNLMGLIAPL